MYFIAARFGDHQTLELWNLQCVSGELNQLAVRKQGPLPENRLLRYDWLSGDGRFVQKANSVLVQLYTGAFLLLI